MKKIMISVVFVGIIVALLGCSAHGNPISSKPSPTEFLVLPLEAAGELVNASPLRSGPGVDFDEIATLPKGTTVNILGASPDIKWYLMTYTNLQGVTMQGWISTDAVNLKMQTPDPSIPSTPIPPLITSTQIPTATPTIILIYTPTTTITNTPSQTAANPTQTRKKKTPKPTLVSIPSPTPSKTGTPQRAPNP